MPTLADYLNSPREIEFEGKTWWLRQATIDQEGIFQRWLEQKAYDAIEKRNYQSDDKKIEDRAALDEAVKVGRFEWGAPLSVKAMTTTAGIAKLVEIVGRDQNMPATVARKLVAERFRDVTLALSSKLEAMDPREAQSEEGSSRGWFLTWLCAPPINRSWLELRQMSWDQIVLMFDIERTPEGNAQITPPSSGKRLLSDEQMFRRRYFLLGITDQSIVDREWTKFLAKRAEEIKKDPRKKPQKQTRRLKQKKRR